jgi:hypothetical protein
MIQNQMRLGKGLGTYMDGIRLAGMLREPILIDLVGKTALGLFLA